MTEGYSNRKADPPPEVRNLLGALVDLMRLRPHVVEVQEACSAAVKAIIWDDPRIGDLLIECGGVPVLLNAVRRATNLGKQGANMGAKCADTIATLADGSNK